MKIRMLTKRTLQHLTPPIIMAICRSLQSYMTSPLAKQKMSNYSRLHLACGSNILDGWANIDLSSDKKSIISWDLTKPLPVSSGTIHYIFSEHFIEHIRLGEGRDLLSECYRVLKPGGVLRVSTPNLRKIIEEYLLGRLIEWSDVSWNPTTPCQMVNEALRLWGHQFVYDADELKRAFEETGFSQVTQVEWRKSKHKGLDGLECRPFHGEIILEGVK